MYEKRGCNQREEEAIRLDTETSSAKRDVNESNTQEILS